MFLLAGKVPRHHIQAVDPYQVALFLPVENSVWDEYIQCLLNNHMLPVLEEQFINACTVTCHN